MTVERPARLPYALLAEACALAVGSRALLRIVSVRTLVRWLGLLPRRQRAGVTATECLDAASQAAAWGAHPTCLFRTLVAFALLARRGVSVTFHLGVARRGGNLDAHAWIAVEGTACGADDGAYAAIWAHPRAPEIAVGVLGPQAS